ncbi:MAG TPA: DUF6531 domain-containing protein [Myxococcaceae bacterium]|nr:DUF6531 domain-containing protein [Myxococcaceae bacterium]
MLQADGSALPVAAVRAGAMRATPRPVRLASLLGDVGFGTWGMEPLLGTLPPPVPEDLAEVAETRRSPELMALVSSLGGKPLALYNYVHAQVMPELYYGSKKGAAETLAEKAGNDFDQANLLVAMLRAANVPARYEYGTVRLSLAQAAALTGGADARIAAFLLAKAGVPAGVGADGKTVLVERAWVRAYVPYGDWRGTGPGGAPVWVRLDPGLKLVKRTQALNLRGLVAFDFDAYLAAPTQQTPREVFEAQLLAKARASNLCRNLDDVLAKTTLAERTYDLLPAEHPAIVESSLLISARPAEGVRWTVDVQVDGESKRLDLPDLQGRRAALEYPGETPADQAAIDAAGSIVGVVPYLVRVTPSLRIDGAEVKRFAGLNPGLSENVTVQVNVPGASAQSATHRVIAGAPHALLVSAGTTPTSRADDERKAVQQAQGDARHEAQGALALALYAAQQEADSVRLFALQGHASIKDVLEGLAGRDLNVTEVGGTPVQLTWGPYVIDIARDSLTPVPMDTDTSQVASLLKLSGYQGSVLEHRVWEQTLGSRSVSAVKILQTASAQLVPVYRLTQGNPDRAHLTGFTSATLSDVDNALGAGLRVTIPQRPVNVDGGYVNQEGYILESLVTGAAAYRINAMLNGGANNGGPGDSPADTNPAPCDSCQPANSTVNMATGTMRESWTDLALPAIGLPVVWTRTYSSRARGLTELGYGWMSSYGMYLRAEVDNSVTYVTEDWREAHFTRSGATWVSAPGWHLALTDLADGKRLRTKEGISYEFNAAGRLRSVTEPSGNQTTIVYQNGLISQVKDSNGSVALSFVYDGGHISGVTDRAGRAVSYQHVGDDLTGFTDVLHHSMSYVYDSAHNLIRRVDLRGQTWLSFYDASDRWVGSRDPLGHEASAYYDAVNLRATYVDRTGAAWTREHNAAGNPTALIDPLGNREERTWDSDLNLRQLKDSRALTTVMTYDSLGNMLTRADPDHRSAIFTYDATFSRVLTSSETGLPPIINTYDSFGRLSTHRDGLGTTSYTYDARGQIETSTQPGNATTTFGHDAHGATVTVTAPASATTTWGYDAAGHVTSVAIGGQTIKTLEVDDAGRATAEIDALQNRVESTYDAAGNWLTTKDPAGKVTSYSHDSNGRLTSVTDALGRTTSTMMDAEGRVTASVDARGFRTTHRYDAAGRLAETTSADGAVTTLGYCALVGGPSGTPCQRVDPAGGTTTIAFDAAGRITSEVDPLGRATEQLYDTGGRLSVENAPDRPRTAYTYGANGLVSNIRTGSGSTFVDVSYEYDGRGNRTRMKFNGSEITDYTYDLANRLLTMKNPLGTTTSYTYDDAGNRHTRLDGNGNLTTYNYDPNRRLQTVVFADATQYSYDYDSRGNRTLERSPNHERQLEFDDLNRVSRVTDVTLGRHIDYAYDPNGNRTSIGSEDFQASYAYDGMNRLKRASANPAAGITFEYDLLGRRDRVARPNGVVSTYAYDPGGEVLSIIHAKAGQVVSSFSYQYDGHGRRTSKTSQDGSTEAYVYDALDRLVGVDYGTARSITYGLDGSGNRISMRETLRSGTAPAQTTTTTATFNGYNQLLTSTTGSAVTSYQYDLNGNLRSQTTGSQVKQFGWDLDNRLRTVGPPAAASGSHEYDARGMRTRAIMGGAPTGFLLSGPSVVEELSGAGSMAVSYLVHPQAFDEIESVNVAGAVFYPLTDALHSITAVTDQDGAVVGTSTYDVYGKRTVTGNGPALGFGFTGREHADVGLTYHRDRFMDTSTGRWLQPDRAGPVDGPNLYVYSANAPVERRDPLGRSIEFEDQELKMQLSDLTSRSVEAYRVWFSVLGSRFIFVVKDKDLSQAADIKFGALGDVTVVGGQGCPDTFRVEVQVDKTRARTWTLKDEDHDSMVYYSAREWEESSIYKDTRMTLFHELLHAVQYIQAVEGRPWYSWPVWTPLEDTPPYEGSEYPPQPKTAVPNNQHDQIWEEVKKVYEEISE